MVNRFFILFLISITAFSCTQLNVYEKNKKIPGYKWDYNYASASTFTISDTTSLYNIYIVLRHTDYYKYSNIWLDVSFQAPGDTIKTQKLELPLASDAGGWEGTGIHDVWEVRKRIIENQAFKKPGNYIFTLKHIMRDNPLPGIMNAGIRVEKTTSNLP